MANGKWDKNVLYMDFKLVLLHMLIKEKKLKDGLDDTAITAEAKYFANITKSRKKNCSRLHYNGIKKFFMLAV